ncbi:MAG: AIR synthase-related protein, partial [Nitrososphaerota archaeon]
ISIIGGHTGVYPGIGYPLNGGCTVIGIGKRDQVKPPSNAKVGDKILLTKGPAIEATGVLAVQAEKTLREVLSDRIVEKAKKHIFNMTVVEDALTCSRFANAMHDATEGGVLNAVYEIAEASNVGCKIYEEKIVIPEEIAAVCNYFQIDPLISISEGTLILTCPPSNVSIIQDALNKRGIESWEIGEIIKDQRVLISKDGSKKILKPVKVDPFWEAYFKSMR